MSPPQGRSRTPPTPLPQALDVLLTEWGEGKGQALRKDPRL